MKKGGKMSEEFYVIYSSCAGKLIDLVTTEGPNKSLEQFLDCDGVLKTELLWFNTICNNLYTLKPKATELPRLYLICWSLTDKPFDVSNNYINRTFAIKILNKKVD